MEQASNFFVVFGETIQSDFSNIESIDSFIIPQIGNKIRCFGKVLRVVDVFIDYKNVDKYRGDDTERGGEYIYVFTKKLSN